MKGCAGGLVFKQRHKITRKWPIDLSQQERLKISKTTHKLTNFEFALGGLVTKLHQQVPQAHQSLSTDTFVAEDQADKQTDPDC